MAAEPTDSPIRPRRGTDPSAAELDLKRRGRRRLIGTITLGLVALVVLPMVFDSEPRGGSATDRAGAKLPKQEIVVQIPEKEGLTPLPPPVAPPISALATAPVAAPASGSLASSTIAVPPTAASAEKSAPLSQVIPAKSATPVAPAKSPEPVKGAVPAKPVASKAEPPVAATSGANFVVQLGAFKDADNAKQVVGKMKELKLPVLTDVIAVAAGKVTRVRVGPFADKAAADSALAQIKLAGVDGKIVPLGN